MRRKDRKKDRKKCALIIFCMCFLTACGKEKTTEIYMYNHEEISSIAIEKTEVYSDKMKIYFSEDAFSDVDKVVCYDKDLALIEEDADCRVSNDILTIYSEKASDISGLRVDVYQDMYLEIRYLDSEKYAMIVYSWADDIGLMPNGDLETYYTDEEKRQQEEIQAEHDELETMAFSLIEGVWEDDNKTVRIEIYEKADTRMVSVYANVDGNYTVSREFGVYNIYSDETSEPVVVYVEDGIGYCCQYRFMLYNDNTEMECEFSEERLKKVE